MNIDKKSENFLVALPIDTGGVSIVVAISVSKWHTGIPRLYTQELDVGLWTLDAGLWTLDAGLWTLNAGLRTLDAGVWTLDSGRWTLKPGR